MFAGLNLGAPGASKPEITKTNSMDLFAGLGLPPQPASSFGGL
jgi:hypothetical protein